MKVGGALLAVLALLVAPVVVSATAPDVYRSPYIPLGLEPKDGTVVLTVGVWNGLTWQTDSTVVQPAGLPIECGAPDDRG